MSGPERGPEERPEPEGTMLRPETVVLGQEALLPDSNIVRPPPADFTHVLIADEPYYFDRPERTGRPDGVFPAGTPVVLLGRGEDRCRVADGRGLSVDVRPTSLRELGT